MDDGELDHGSGDGSGGNLAAAVAVAVAVVDNDCSNSGRQQEHWQLHDGMQWRKRTSDNNATTN